MNINFKLDKEMVKKAGKTSWRIVKAVGIRGIQGLAADAAMKTINKTVKGDISSVKDEIGLDYFIGEEKVKVDKPKKKWFSKKEKTKELIEQASDTVDDLAEDIGVVEALIEEEEK